MRARKRERKTGQNTRSESSKEGGMRESVRSSVKPEFFKPGPGFTTSRSSLEPTFFFVILLPNFCPGWKEKAAYQAICFMRSFKYLCERFCRTLQTHKS